MSSPSVTPLTDALYTKPCTCHGDVHDRGCPHRAADKILQLLASAGITDQVVCDGLAVKLATELGFITRNGRRWSVLRPFVVVLGEEPEDPHDANGRRPGPHPTATP